MDNGDVAEALNDLVASGHTFEEKGALWFRSTAFGDDKDRVLKRDNGETTYFASDVAYIRNKLKRGFDRVIYVFGADHHGYVARMKAATQALGFDPERVEFQLVQFVSLYRNGEKAQMSTRSGEFITLEDLRQEVGNDAARSFTPVAKSTSQWTSIWTWRLGNPRTTRSITFSTPMHECMPYRAS